MDDVEVDLSYLDQLATQQEEAAETIQGAIDGAEDLRCEIGFVGALKTAVTSVKGVLPGTTGGLWIDHGVVCFAGIGAFGDALDSRKAAAEKMQTVSAGLAEKLRVASGAYSDTDEQTGDNLDNQMLGP